MEILCYVMFTLWYHVNASSIFALEQVSELYLEPCQRSGMDFSRCQKCLYSELFSPNAGKWGLE